MDNTDVNPTTGRKKRAQSPGETMPFGPFQGCKLRRLINTNPEYMRQVVEDSELCITDSCYQVLLAKEEQLRSRKS